MSDPHREDCRRQHRVIGHYLALQAWHRGLDCIVLNRTDLERFLGLKRFKKERIDWLRADLKPWFPFQKPYYLKRSKSSIHSLFLSRADLTQYLPAGMMTTEERITGMKPGSPKTELFSEYDKVPIPSQAEMVSYLALLAAGLRTPQQIVGLATPMEVDEFLKKHGLYLAYGEEDFMRDGETSRLLKMK